MKTLLLSLVIISALKTAANDTLTRAQVYNFSIGDTFDYRTSDYSYNDGCISWNPLDTASIAITVNYTRYIIKNIWYSFDSSTRYIHREQVFPLPIVYDTMVIQNLSEYEIYTDTVLVCGDSIITGNFPQYYNRAFNIFLQSGCESELIHSVVTMMIQGLGIALDTYTAGNLGCDYTDSIVLIYYSQGSQKCGTPYYDWPDYTSIKSLNADNEQISVFPTLNNGTFNVKIPNSGLLPANFIVYDITGREIKRVILNNQDNNINIQPCGAGMYIWKTITPQKLIQAGKIVVR